MTKLILFDAEFCRHERFVFENSSVYCTTNLVFYEHIFLYLVSKHKSVVIPTTIS